MKFIDEANLEIGHIINTKVIDRYYTIVLPEGMDSDNYKKNKVVLWIHNSAGRRMPIGTNTLLNVDTDKVEVRTKFMDDAFSKKVFNAYRDGFLNTWSIGFQPKAYKLVNAENREEMNRTYNLTISEAQLAEAEDNSWAGLVIIDKWELLEYSAVPVPGNPEAVTEGLKEELVTRGLLTLEEVRDLNSNKPEIRYSEITGGKMEEKDLEVNTAESIETPEADAVVEPVVEEAVEPVSEVVVEPVAVEPEVEAEVEAVVEPVVEEVDPKLAEADEAEAEAEAEVEAIVEPEAVVVEPVAEVVVEESPEVEESDLAGLRTQLADAVTAITAISEAVVALKEENKKSLELLKKELQVTNVNDLRKLEVDRAATKSTLWVTDLKKKLV